MADDEKYCWRWDGDCLHVEWILGLTGSHETAEPERVEAYSRLAAASHEQRWGCSEPLRLTTSVPLSHFTDDDG